MFISGEPSLWLIPALPLLSAVLLFFFSRRMTAGSAVGLACAGVLASFVWTVVCAFHLVGAEGKAHFHQVYYQWLNVGILRSDFAMLFDKISMTFALVITGVGSVIHIYSAGYLHGDGGERRYFAYLNLFVASMLILVLADNALLMFLGWEGVGACSFLLIGHWYQKKENVAAATKAFLVTRFGDVFLVLGVLLCAALTGASFLNLGGFEEIAKTPSVAAFGGLSGQTLILIAGLLLLGGAAGKSAQLPLQAWLPDAMAGPTPVSALIHAATMVTAGVYLIARFFPLFGSNETLMAITAIIGAGTAFYGATCAIVQTDIKRILAYSTISQIGFMILALGAGAFSLALFHFFTHAFFKALLFLAAGTVIHSLHGEQNIYRMGGLKRELRGTYLATLAGAAALAGLPLVTSGFYSKDAILWFTLSGDKLGAPLNTILYGTALLTALLTAIYSFRLIAVVFHGEARSHIHVHAPGRVLTWPLYVLAVPSLLAGFLNIPVLFPKWERVFAPSFGVFHAHPSHNHALELGLAALSGGLALFGAFLGFKLFGGRAETRPAPVMPSGDIQLDTPKAYAGFLPNFLFRGWQFDGLYHAVAVAPYRIFSRFVAKFDRIFVDNIYELVSAVARVLHSLLLTLQNGRLSRYALFMLVGAALLTLMLTIAKS